MKQISITIAFLTVFCFFISGKAQNVIPSFICKAEALVGLSSAEIHDCAELLKLYKDSQDLAQTTKSKKNGYITYNSCCIIGPLNIKVSELVTGGSGVFENCPPYGQDVPGEVKGKYNDKFDRLFCLGGEDSLNTYKCLP